jgi:transcriptional/translational regulatory protein YebC/TACO1
VKHALDANKIKYESAHVTMLPKNTIKVEGKEAEQLLKLMDMLEENEDIQNIYSNFDIDISVMEQIG